MIVGLGRGWDSHCITFIFILGHIYLSLIWWFHKEPVNKFCVGELPRAHITKVIYHTANLCRTAVPEECSRPNPRIAQLTGADPRCDSILPTPPPRLKPLTNTCPWTLTLHCHRHHASRQSLTPSLNVVKLRPPHTLPDPYQDLTTVFIDANYPFQSHLRQ
jgi:hypothetical protein